MFQNKNNQTIDGGQTNLSQERDLPIEDLPVHTMKKDLETLKNPELAEAEIKYQESAAQPINRETLTEAQKGSPFLDFSAPQKSASESIEYRPDNIRPAISDSRIKLVEPAPEPEKPAASYKSSSPFFEKPVSKQAPAVPAFEKPVLNSEKNLSAPEQHPHHINFGKVFAGAAAVLIVLIIAAGGYYFWTTRQTVPEVAITPPITEPEPEPTPEPKPVAKFSTDEPNYLAVDIAATAGAAIKEILQNTAKEVADAKITLPVEFKIIDLTKNPVALKTFAGKSELLFSPALSANLADTFSLFIYNDVNVTRMGIAIDSKEPAKLKSLMAPEEKNLAKELSPLFLAAEYTLPAKIFATGDYNGLAIRYINIISPENLSVDYAIYNNKLVIGTTKMTLRSIIDYLKPQLE